MVLWIRGVIPGFGRYDEVRFQSGWIPWFDRDCYRWRWLSGGYTRYSYRGRTTFTHRGHAIFCALEWVNER